MIRITKFRKEKGLTQKNLAEAAGISTTQMALVEEGHYRPQPVTLLKIARVLGADAGELLTEWDELDGNTN